MNEEKTATGTNWVVIAGTRTYTNYEQMRAETTEILKEIPNAGIISGGATGADALAKRYAQEHLLPYWEMPAKWNEEGRAAGPLRNARMANEATYTLVYWDNRSQGTLNMLHNARRQKHKKIYVYLYEHDVQHTETNTTY